MRTEGYGEASFGPVPAASSRFAIGVYPEITLAAARQLALEARQVIREGRDHPKR